MNKILFVLCGAVVVNAILTANAFAMSSAPQVPEPISASLLILGGAAMLSKKFFKKS